VQVALSAGTVPTYRGGALRCEPGIGDPSVVWWHQVLVGVTREDVDCGIGSVAARWGCGGMWQVPGGGMCVSVCVCVSRVCVRCGMSSVCGCRLRAPGCWMD